MQTVFFRRWTLAFGLLSGVAIGWVLLYHECASGGAMGGSYQDCSCLGMERVSFDNTAADGPLRTVCIGWVTSRACYRDRGGLQIPCKQTTL